MTFVASRRLLAALLSGAALPLTAQSAIDLTGRPAATITEPFTRIIGIRELGTKVVIADPTEQRLVLGDLTTGAVQPIARTGSGPNEYQRPLDVLSGPGAQTFISDPTLGRVAVVSPDGKITTTIIPPGFEAMPTMARARGIDAQGRLYFQGSSLGPSGLLDSVPLLRWDTRSKNYDTVGTWATGLSMSRAAGPSGGMTMSRRGPGATPFAAADAWLVLPDGKVAIVRANPFRIDLFDGRQLKPGTAIAYTPIPVTAADRDAYRKQQSTQPVRVTGFGGGSATMPAPPPVEDEAFPRMKPAFLGEPLASPTGEIWIPRARAAGDATPVYEIYSGAGQLVAKATLKPNSTVVGFGGGAVYVARKDPSDDQVYLEKYLVAKAP